MKTVFVILALTVCALCFDSLYTSKPVVDIMNGNTLLGGIVLNTDSTVAYFADQGAGTVYSLDLITLVKTSVACMFSPIRITNRKSWSW